MTFVSIPDYESQSSYVATVSASDGQNSTEQDIVISIVDLSEFAPIFGNTSFEVLEQEIDIGTIDVSDADGDNLSLSLSVDKDSFNLNSSFRTIKFINPPSYEEKNRYETTVTAFDGINTTTQALVVNITQLPSLANHPQAIIGTIGDDELNRDDRQYNILIGGAGDDVITGGINQSSTGGYLIDIYQFADNSGKDIIKDFFIQK